MCGIVGLISFTQNLELEQIVKQMSDFLYHRGPDDDGVWTDAESGIGLGHRRLSILDLSSAGHQPMHSASGRFVIAFNGEIYNHLELRTELAVGSLRLAGWRGHSDTETLLACFEAWGIEETLKRAVGMFAIAVWDRRERLLPCCLLILASAYLT